MLELFKTDSITAIEDLKDFIAVIFIIVDDILQHTLKIEETVIMQ